MELIIKILWAFVVFSFLGWAAKFVWLSILKRRPVNPGFITLPFLPASGIGAVAIILVTYNMNNNWMIFLGSALVLTVGKYLCAMAFEKTFGFKWRDYSKRPLNLNGHVTLWETVAYGFIALFIKNFALDIISSFTNLMPFWLRLLIPLIIFGMIVFDLVISVITVIHLRRNLKQMSDISSLIEDQAETADNEELRAIYERKMMTSKRFRRRLVNAFPDMESFNYEKQFADLRERIDVIKETNDKVYSEKIENPKARPFAYGLGFEKLFWLFLAGSVFGTIMETVWALFTEGRFEIRTGFVWGPFIPIYGGGAVAITLCLYKLHKAKDLVIYLASAVIGATFEYFCSYFQEMFLGTVSWDYSDLPFNIDGRTSLMFALIWGLLGLFWLRYIYPGFSRLIEKIPKKKGTIITIVLFVIILADGLLSIAAVYRFNQRSKGVNPTNAAEVWLDKTFDDDYIKFVFPHMENK
jgi:uncharacterized membrane protein